MVLFFGAKGGHLMGILASKTIVLVGWLTWAVALVFVYTVLKNWLWPAPVFCAWTNCPAPESTQLWLVVLQVATVVLCVLSKAHVVQKTSLYCLIQGIFVATALLLLVGVVALLFEPNVQLRAVVVLGVVSGLAIANCWAMRTLRQHFLASQRVNT